MFFFGAKNWFLFPTKPIQIIPFFGYNKIGTMYFPKGLVKNCQISYCLHPSGQLMFFCNIKLAYPNKETNLEVLISNVVNSNYVQARCSKYNIML